MKLSGRDRRVAIIGGVGAALILLYYFGVDPLVSKWGALNKRIAQQEKVLRDMAEGRSLRGRAEELRERIGREATSYVAVEEFNTHMPRMITQLTDFSTYPAVSRLDMMPLQMTETHAQSSVSLSFDCTMQQLVEFLYDLQRARPLLVAKSLRVNTDEKNPSVLRVRMTVSSFAMLEEEGAG